MANKISRITGNVGGDPKEFDTSSQKAPKVVRFSVAVVTKYGEDQEMTWFQVAVFNEDLRRQALEQIKKGSKVAIEGEISTNTYKDEEQMQIIAVRIGLVSWFTRANSTYQKKERETGGDEW